MKNFITSISILAFSFLSTFTTSVSAQGLVDGFFSKQGDVSLTAGYAHGSADEFFVGDVKMGPIPAHGEFSQNIYSLYAKYAILDDLTFIASIPYISISGGDDGVADPINGSTEESGFQDIQLALKYRFASIEAGSGRLDFLGALGVNIAGGYESNGILSIGSGANSADLHLGFHYATNFGLFLSGVSGYSVRGSADNNFNVVGGRDLDVPNAIVGMAKLGYAGEKFYADVFFDYQNAQNIEIGGNKTSIDIMGEGFMGNFPETQVNFSRIGASVFYPFTQNLGVSAGYSTIISGRNIADFSYINAGVTYSFGTK